MDRWKSSNNPYIKLSLLTCSKYQLPLGRLWQAQGAQPWLLWRMAFYGSTTKLLIMLFHMLRRICPNWCLLSIRMRSSLRRWNLHSKCSQLTTRVIIVSRSTKIKLMMAKKELLLPWGSMPITKSLRNTWGNKISKSHTLSQSKRLAMSSFSNKLFSSHLIPLKLFAKTWTRRKRSGQLR